MMYNQEKISHLKELELTKMNNQIFLNAKIFR